MSKEELEDELYQERVDLRNVIDLINVSALALDSYRFSDEGIGNVRDALFFIGLPLLEKMDKRLREKNE